ncbi:MAG: UvrD-helicase domain-containing protein, partial [Candidatus Binatia bacterium]
MKSLVAADPAFLEHLASRKVAPSKLSGLVRKVLGSPDLRLLPERAAAPSADLADRVVALKLDLVEHVRREAAARKQRRNVMSFDDLLVRVRDALRGTHGNALAARVRERYTAALIDEFQDTDPIQYEIFDRIWHRAGAPLFLIGDPKQAIYAFRGADVFTYLEGRKAAAAAHHLTVNYRSDPGLLAALNVFFAESPTPFRIPGIEYHPVDPDPRRRDALGPPDEMTAPLRILFLGGSETKGKRRTITQPKVKEYLPRAVAGEIVRLLERRSEIAADKRGERRPIEPGDIAVLCRANWQARDVQAALQDLGVPAVLHGDRSVFESDEARDLLAVLEAIAEPSDPRLIRSALVTTLIGATANRLVELGDDDEEWDRYVACFVDWRDTWVERGFMRAFRRLLDEPVIGHEKVPARLLALPRGERRLTNVLHVAELLHKESVTGHRGPHELIDWCRREIDDAPRAGELAPEELQIRLESDARAVTLTTIHKAKGLE